MESFQNGVIDHVEGENGDFVLENLNNESGDNFENSQTLELFLSIQQHFARSMTGNQGSDLPIEGKVEFIFLKHLNCICFLLLFLGFLE